MDKKSKPAFLIFILLFANAVYAQTLRGNDVIIATNVPDFLNGRFNVGVEYFLPSPAKNSTWEDWEFSIALNGGRFSTNQLQKSVEGYNLIFEANAYTNISLPRKWNEFGGLCVSYGNLKNQTDGISNRSYFVGISTGVQPVVAKIITIKLVGYIGYFGNVLSHTMLWADRSELFHSGFAIDFNVGIGVRF